MDDSVRNTEGGMGNAGQPAPVLDAGPDPAEGTGKRGPGLKDAAAAQKTADKQDAPVQQPNPALKFGRRMDYKTAKVNDKQTKDLNLSLAPSNIGQPERREEHKAEGEEPKSALELELEALEAAAAQPIPNPLPTPKKRVPKEMEFDIEPPEYAMHFDLVDMHGKDYFDIN